MDRTIVFVHLTADRDVLKERMQSREGHFMPTSLLDSQLSALEPPQADENFIEVNVSLSKHDVINVVEEEIVKRRT